MPDQEFIDLIKDKMKGWDGTTAPPVNQVQQLEQWAEEMQAWGRKVRRDILVLERHVAKLTGPFADPKRMFYGDPGDPPPTEGQ